MFESRSEWFTHELQFHRREWVCGESGHKVYDDRGSFERHLRQSHNNQFSEAQLSTFIKSCERATQSELIKCPLCTEDHIIGGNEDKEPVIQRDPKYVPRRIFKRHLSRHLERLALFAISSTEDEADEEASLPSDNLNSGASRLSWIDEDVSSSSSERSAPDNTTDFMEKLASPWSKDSTNGLGPKIHSTSASSTDDLPPELQPVVETTNKINLPCVDVRPHTKNPNFVGREETFATIQAALDPKGDGSPRTFRQIFALCGSGGVGKTQTALNYVFEEMEKFQVVFWAHASSQTQLIQSFSRFALKLGIVEEKEGKEDVPTLDADLLKDWFNEAGTYIYQKCSY
jgi:hypothetical protein